MTHHTPSTLSVALQLLLLVGSVFTLHCLTLYQGSLLSSLVRDRPASPPVSSIADILSLIQQKRAVLDLYHTDAFHHEAILLSGSSAFVGFAEALRQNPPMYEAQMTPDEYHAHLDMLVANRMHYIYVSDSYDIIMDLKLADMEGTCNFYVIPTPVTLWRAFVLSPKLNASIIRAVNEAIGRNMELIMSELDRTEDVLRKHRRCRMEKFKDQSREPGDPIELRRLAIVFVVAIGGFVVAASALGWEMITGGQAKSDETRFSN